MVDGVERKTGGLKSPCLLGLCVVVLVILLLGKLFGEIVEYGFVVSFLFEADELFCELAFVEDDYCGNCVDIEFDGGFAVVVGVYLADFDFALVVIGDFVYGWAERFAGATPFRPEVDEYGSVALQDFCFKIGIRNFYYILTGHGF